MKCPHFKESRKEMYEMIYLVHPKVKMLFKSEPPNVFPWLIGKTIDGINHEIMQEVWKISGCTINKMYKVIRMRKGIG